MTSSRTPRVGRNESRHALVTSHWFQTGMTIDAAGLSMGGFSPWTGVMDPLSTAATRNRGSGVSRLLESAAFSPKEGGMITFGICIGSEDKFEKYALPGLRRHAEPDSAIAESTGNTSIFKAYNEMLEAFAGKPGLEALVLLHDDVELRDDEFCAKVRARLADPDIAVIGAIGARSVTSLSWWEGEGFGRAEETRGLVTFGGV